MGATTEDNKDIFPWPKELTGSYSNLIDSVVRIDIAFSKGLNEKLAWYDSVKYYSTIDNRKDADIKKYWAGYDQAFKVDFKKALVDNEEKEKQAPIDYLADEKEKKSWYSFIDNEPNVSPMTCKPTCFAVAQGDLSYRIFKKTGIKQILIFPTFSQKGFASNCIVALSNPIDESLIFVLMAVCVAHSYRISLDEFSTLLRKEAIKSAKAAIMSRNISHNLGSHVMAYMKQSLSSVEDMLKNGVLMYAHQKDEKLNYEIPYLVGVGKFLSYLQERQDYIATVSTDYIPYPSVVNFKDAIYDELNPDYRFQRHTEWAGHKPANILLENIAKSEGLSRKTLEEGKLQEENNIIIKYREFDGQKPKEGEIEKNKDYDSLRQWNFSLPGGIMGRQAIFSIVENVIRNAAKHGIRKKGENLIVSFDIVDPLLDPNSVDKEYVIAEDIRDLYVVKLTTSTRIVEADLQKIYDAINDYLIEDNGQLKQSNKGIKEMLISAAWLRSIKIEDYDPGQISKKARILKANMVDDGKLQYVFCLPKVKEVAMITERLNEETLNEDVVMLMKQHGWYIYTIDEYIKCPNKDFCFVIIDPKICVNVNGATSVEYDSNLQKIIDSVKKKSHNRYYVATDDYTNIISHEIKTEIFEKITSFTNDDCFNKAVLDLYSELADEPDLHIAIVDKDFKDSLSKEQLKAVSNKVSLLDNEDGVIEDYNYIYRKHNDTEEQFKGFLEVYGLSGFYKDLVFVEGITGGNSTDRLVRHAALDALWACKQIHAMKTKVAIFDERIFTKVTGLEMADLTTERDAVWNFNGFSVQEAKNFVLDYDKKRSKKIKGDVFDQWYSLQKFDEVIKFADSLYSLQKATVSQKDNVGPMIFHKKGIDVFTLTWEKEGRFLLWGFVPDDSYSGGCFGKIDVIGEIDVNSGNNDLVQLRKTDGFDYHYLSIHQGLLDKVYEKFSSVGMPAEKKLEVTKSLHSKFVDCRQTDENDYLQGLIIHSGRSKPNEENMPQHQPFLQYSAIEYAVFDCKYSLVELMDYACFESSHN